MNERPLTDAQRLALAEYRGFCRGSVIALRDQVRTDAPTWAEVHQMRAAIKVVLAILDREQLKQLALTGELKDCLANGGASDGDES